MGKKACLSLDLDYDPEADEYHDGDEYYDIYYEEESDGQHEHYFPSTKGEAWSSERNGTNWNSTNASTDTARGKSMSSNLSSKAKPFTVVTPKTTAAKLHYIPNPHRQPLLTDYIATQDALLVHTVSYLSMIEVTTLSLVSKQLQESLSADGLYCTTDGGAGMLLPVLRAVSHRLLPIDSIRHRPPGLSRTFAYECLSFSKSFSKPNRTIEPRCILAKKTPEQMNAISFKNVNWEQSSCSGVGKGSKSPPQKLCMKSGVRLSYVQSESNDCAIVTMWVGEHCIAKLPPGDQRQFTRERYLPPNTKTIVEASIYSDYVAMLATPLEHYSTERYILSLVVLPNIPPGIMKTALKTEQRLPKSDKHVLKWQKHLSANNWELFSSSETHPIVSFSSQGTYVIFGSTERWGVIEVDSGSQIWSLSDPDRVLPTLSLNTPAAKAPATPICPEQSPATSTSVINAYLLHHEFLFVLERKGTFMRVYDVSDSSSREPVAEGSIPWSFMKSQRHKQAQGLVKLHHTHQHHQKLLRHEFELCFCAGCIWITGICNRDLLCSSPSRLLRRLRSRLHSISSSRGRDVLQLQFTRMKTDLNLGTPHSMHTWNDTHLYVVDSDRVHCWRSNNATLGTSENAADEATISTILMCKGSFIENIHVDGTKIIASTNRTFRNTTTRDWDGSGSIWVFPIDHGFRPTDCTPASTSPPPVQSQNEDELNLVGRQAYSPVKIYHNKLFPGFVGSTARIGGSRPRYPISSSTNSNYQVLDIIICDGRYVLSQCKKGSSWKTVIFDLYR